MKAYMEFQDERSSLNIYNNILKEKIIDCLQGVKDQTEIVTADLSKPANFGVVKRLRDNDPAIHENKILYSCGSLAPKMGKGRTTPPVSPVGSPCTDTNAIEMGCSSSLFKKSSQPWECADGVVHLIAELCSISGKDSAPRMTFQKEKETTPQQKTPLISIKDSLSTQIFPMLTECLNLKHYTQRYYLLETFCKRLPDIAKGLGKTPFKRHLEGFLDPIFDAVNSTDMNAACHSAAVGCLQQLSSFLGPNILKSRIEMYQQNYVHQLELLNLH